MNKQSLRPNDVVALVHDLLSLLRDRKIADLKRAVKEGLITTEVSCYTSTTHREFKVYAYRSIWAVRQSCSHQTEALQKIFDEVKDECKELAQDMLKPPSLDFVTGKVLFKPATAAFINSTASKIELALER